MFKNISPKDIVKVAEPYREQKQNSLRFVLAFILSITATISAQGLMAQESLTDSEYLVCNNDYQEMEKHDRFIHFIPEDEVSGFTFNIYAYDLTELSTRILNTQLNAFNKYQDFNSYARDIYDYSSGMSDLAFYEKTDEIIKLGYESPTNMAETIWRFAIYHQTGAYGYFEGDPLGNCVSITEEDYRAGLENYYYAVKARLESELSN